jgi:LuxR family transcriptional regulator, maltose regulon positive regulatory protein
MQEIVLRRRSRPVRWGEESFGDWHLEPREQLRRQFVEGLLALGELLMRGGDYQEALRVHERVLVIDDLHEATHRRLMVCLAHTGERARALRHYERLVSLLRDELGADPEPETVALLQQLLQADTLSA